LPLLSVDARLIKIKKQNLALEAKDQGLKERPENKDLIKIGALIKKADLSAQDIIKAMKGTRGRKDAGVGKLAGRKVAPKYRSPSDKNQRCTGRGRMPEWAAELSEAGRLEKALIK
jgi:DNA-binding protein H-NS